MPMILLCASSTEPLEGGKQMESSAHGWSGPFSERIPSELRVPSKFRAYSEQTSQKNRYFLVILCNESPQLADNKEHISLWSEANHARNLAETNTFSSHGQH